MQQQRPSAAKNKFKKNFTDHYQGCGQRGLDSTTFPENCSKPPKIIHSQDDGSQEHVFTSSCPLFIQLTLEAVSRHPPHLPNIWAGWWTEQMLVELMSWVEWEVAWLGLKVGLRVNGSHGGNQRWVKRMGCNKSVSGLMVGGSTGQLFLL